MSEKIVFILSVSAGNSYSEYQFIDIFLDNFHQGGKYTADIASHQAQLRREVNVTDQKYLSITSLQTDYLNLDSSSGSGRSIEGENIVQKKWSFCGSANHSAEKCFKRIKKD